MNKNSNAFAIVLTLSFAFVGSAFANNQQEQNTMVLNYDGFFDRMDDLEAPEYSAIKLAFYLKNETGDPCQVKSVELKTKQKSLDVYFMPDGELLLPFEPKFDQDKAAIVINKKNSKPCGLDMRLESTLLFSSTVNSDQSLGLIDTFDTAFSDLGGMMSFMLPRVSGISFMVEAGQELYLFDKSLGLCKDNSCTITKKEISDYNKPLKFNVPPKKSVPFIK